MVAKRHCLVRPYLGKRSKKYTEADFSLRNFILGLDDLKRLDFDVDDLAKTLGKAYAIMHWAAHVNADDVEFVFGSTLVGGTGGDDTGVQHQKISLHLIDFGQCDKVGIDGTKEEILQSFKGAMVTGDNAYFIPNIHRNPRLFDTFMAAYSSTVKQTFDSERTRLFVRR